MAIGYGLYSLVAFRIPESSLERVEGDRQLRSLRQPEQLGAYRGLRLDQQLKRQQ